MKRRVGPVKHGNESTSIYHLCSYGCVLNIDTAHPLHTPFSLRDVLEEPAVSLRVARSIYEPTISLLLILYLHSYSINFIYSPHAQS